MYCPECSSEFRPGFTRCARCGVDLVDRLPEPPVEDIEHDDVDPVTVFVTSDGGEAAMVRSLLEASGVDVHLFDENLSRIDSPLAMIIGGVKVAVPRGQEELALAVLQEFRGRAGQDPHRGKVIPFASEGPDESFAGEIPAPNEEFRCPRCRAVLEPESTACPDCGHQLW